MSFWDKIYKSNRKKTTNRLSSMGRFSPSNKDKAKIQLWDSAVFSFDQKKYKESIIQVLDYVRNEKNNNIEIITKESCTSFSILHGSKKVKGFFDDEYFYAEVPIVKTNEKKIGLLREACEATVELQYSRYALSDENVLTLVFDSYLPESSPYKIFYGLKEIAQFADKKDDILQYEFNDVENIDPSSVINIEVDEKKIKWDLFQKILTDCEREDYFGALNSEKFKAAYSYIYLNAIYKLDFLIKPESRLMELTENAHKKYFEKKDSDLISALDLIKEEIAQMRKISEAEFNKEVYEVVSTFSWTDPGTLDHIQKIIDAELSSFDWYYEQKRYDIAEAICGYIVGYIFFHYTVPEPIRLLGILYYEMVESEYFHRWTGEEEFLTYKKLSGKELKKKISLRLKSVEHIYPHASKEVLDFNDHYTLQLKQILLQMKQLNLE